MHTRKICQSLLLTALVAWCDQGFFLSENGQGRNAPTYAQGINTTPATGTADLTINIQSDSSGNILTSLFGNNINGWMGLTAPTNSSLLANMRAAGISQIRLPGGSWSDNWMWDGSVPQNVADHYDTTVLNPPKRTWTLSTDNMLSIIDSVGVRPEPIVNFALSRYYTGSTRVNQAASYAASWVRSINSSTHLKARYWEIGNENYGSWEAGWSVTGLDTINGTEYGNNYLIFADSMKAVDPTIHLGCVVAGYNNGDSYSGFNWWTQKVLSSAGNKCDYLINHEYFTWSSNLNTITPAQVMASLPLIATEKKLLDSMSLALAGKVLPVAQTEYNFRAGKKQVSFLSVAFTTSALMEFAKNNYALVNLWDVTNAYDTTNGDMGMLSLSDPQLADYSPQPSFYSYWLAHQFLGHKIHTSTVSGDSSGIHFLASGFADGSSGLTIVNTSGKSKTLAPNFGSGATGNLIWYTIDADSISAPILRVNGIGPTQTGSHGPELYGSILPRVQPYQSGTQITLPPYSATYLILSSQNIQGITAIQSTPKAQIQDINGSLQIQQAQGWTQARLLNSQGQKLQSFEIQNGSLNAPLNLSSGNYWIELINSQGEMRRFQIKHIQ